MEFFRIKKDIAFMQYAFIFNSASILIFLTAVFFLLNKGLHFSVEFTGGTVIEITYPGQNAVNLDQIRTLLQKSNVVNSIVQNFGNGQDIIIRIPAMYNMNIIQQGERIFEILKIHTPTIKLQRVEFIGPQVSDELVLDSLIVFFIIILSIMMYLIYRFEWKCAIASIVANLHDVVIVLGFFSYFKWEFSLTVLAAILAVLGYSINESIVVFDRVREVFRDADYQTMSIRNILDHAITSMISRTIITHGSTEMMVLCMLIFGGASLHYFAITLLIGILFSIYSSVFVAVAIAMWLNIKREDFHIRKIKKDL